MYFYKNLAYFELLYYFWHMVRQIIDIQSDVAVHTPFNSDQLIVEISESNLTLMVKIGNSTKVDALEVFDFDPANDDWFDVFYFARNSSNILSRGYNATKIFFNLPEVVLVPNSLFDINHINDYVEAIHGSTGTNITKSEKVGTSPDINVVYRISKSLFDMIHSNFMMVDTEHVYTSFIKRAINSPYSAGTFLKVQFYHHQMVVALVQYGKLQIVQSFSFTVSDDVVYHLLNLSEQFNISISQTDVELSGIIDEKATPYMHIKKLFAKVFFETTEHTAEFTKANEEYPDYYFLPYLKLVV